MKTSTVHLRWLLNIVFLTAIVAFQNCGKDEKKPQVGVVPLSDGAEIHFRGYVTDEEDELVSQIHNFSRKLIREDTLDGQPVYVYNLNNQEAFFFTDENGTLWQYNTEDLGSRIVAYGFAFTTPITVSYWQILLKVDDGVGTEWRVSIDTTFNAVNLAGETQRVRYIYKGKARYEGWTEVFMPESYTQVPVLDAHWYELNTTILNESSGDTLFASLGTAHQYFDPTLGAVKYITDFTKTEIGKKPVLLHGTWELVRKDLPGDPSLAR